MPIHALPEVEREPRGLYSVGVCLSLSLFLSLSLYIYTYIYTYINSTIANYLFVLGCEVLVVFGFRGGKPSKLPMTCALVPK